MTMGWDCVQMTERCWRCWNGACELMKTWDLKFGADGKLGKAHGGVVLQVGLLRHYALHGIDEEGVNRSYSVLVTLWMPLFALHFCFVHSWCFVFLFLSCRLVTNDSWASASQRVLATKQLREWRRWIWPCLYGLRFSAVHSSTRRIIFKWSLIDSIATDSSSILKL